MIKKTKKIRKSHKPCPFCVKKVDPVYSDLESLSVGISVKKRIVSRWTTGVCEKHQLRLARAIKRARHLALLPFVDKI
jgi:small subunit ribosomal protein S18